MPPHLTERNFSREKKKVKFHKIYGAWVWPNVIFWPPQIDIWSCTHRTARPTFQLLTETTCSRGSPYCEACLGINFNFFCATITAQCRLRKRISYYCQSQNTEYFPRPTLKSWRIFPKFHWPLSSMGILPVVDEPGLGAWQLKTLKTSYFILCWAESDSDPELIYPTLTGAINSRANFVNSGERIYVGHSFFSPKHTFE